RKYTAVHGPGSRTPGGDPESDARPGGKSRRCGSDLEYARKHGENAEGIRTAFAVYSGAHRRGGVEERLGAQCLGPGFSGQNHTESRRKEMTQIFERFLLLLLLPLNGA